MRGLRPNSFKVGIGSLDQVWKGNLAKHLPDLENTAWNLDPPFQVCGNGASPLASHSGTFVGMNDLVQNLPADGALFQRNISSKVKRRNRVARRAGWRKVFFPVSPKQQF